MPLQQVLMLLTAPQPLTITNCLKKLGTPLCSHVRVTEFSEQLRPSKVIWESKMTSSGQEEGRLYPSPSTKLHILHLPIISPTAFSHGTG